MSDETELSLFVEESGTVSGSSLESAGAPTESIFFDIDLAPEITYTVTRCQSYTQCLFAALFQIILVHFALKHLYLSDFIRNDWLENELVPENGVTQKEADKALRLKEMLRKGTLYELYKMLRSATKQANVDHILLKNLQKTVRHLWQKDLKQATEERNKIFEQTDTLRQKVDALYHDHQMEQAAHPVDQEHSSRPSGVKRLTLKPVPVADMYSSTSMIKSMYAENKVL